MSIAYIHGRNADYIVEQGNHIGGVNIRTDDYLKADAYVVEMTGNPLSHWSPIESVQYAHHLSVAIVQGYPQIFQEAKARGKPIWNTDVIPKNPGISWARDLLELTPNTVLGALVSELVFQKLEKSKLPRRKLMKWIAFTGLTGLISQATKASVVAGAVSLIKKGKIPKWLLELGITEDDLVKNAVQEGRSVVTAEKIATTISKEMARRLGRKPVIYVWMGSGHLSLPKLLENDAYRKEILQAFTPLEKYYEGPTVRHCIEYDFPKGEGEPTVKIHENAIPRTLAKSTRKRMHRMRTRETEHRMTRRDLFRRMLRHG